MKTENPSRRLRVILISPRSILFLLAFSTGHFTDAYAASLYSSSEFFESDFDTGLPVQTPCMEESFTGSHTQCAGSFSVGSAVINYNAYASADYGVFHAYSEQSLVNGSTNAINLFQASGTSKFRDQWTIHGGAAGTTGTLELGFKFTGNYSSSTTGALAATGLLLKNYNLNTFDDATEFLPSGSAGSLSYTEVLTTPVTFGVTLDFDVHLLASTLLSGQRFDTGTMSATLDLSNTVTMTSIVVRDSSGAVIPFNLDTASGAALFNELTPIPVPAAFWLFSSGIGGLMWMARRRKFIGRVAVLTRRATTRT